MECSRPSQAEILEGYGSLCGGMRGGFTAYVWLTSLYPSLGWILCGISGRTDLRIAGGAAVTASCLSPMHVVQHGWVSIPVVRASASVESSTEDLQTLTVVQLRARLKEFGLIVGGKKAELVERLREGINTSTGVGKKGGTPSNVDNTRTSVELSPPLNHNLNDEGGNVNSLTRQEEGHHECEFMDNGKVETPYKTNNSIDELDKEPQRILKTKQRNTEEELLSHSKHKPPKPRLLTDDDLLPPKRSRHSPSNHHFSRR